MRILKIVILSLFALIAIYFLGPKPSKPELNKVLPTVVSISGLDQYITSMEATHKIKPNNQARIIWADSSKTQTEYAIVYLHGFSASQKEGDPVHQNIAKQFNCNLYLARLAEHGIDTTEDLMNLTADKYWESAKLAYAIGKQIGKKVILMGTSTGGTLALQLAANYPEIAGLILYSPNIEVFNPSAPLLNNPWGLQIGRAVLKSNYVDIKYKDSAYPSYWNKHYRIEGVVALQNLLEATMTEGTFKKIHQPTLALYYYKDEQHQDSIVKVSAMKEMFTQLSTKETEKRAIALPLTENHVIASPIKSKDVAGVERETKSFLEQVIHLQLKN
jgi:esterase/lipase